MNPSQKKTLVLLPSLPAKKVSDHAVILTQKFLDGVLEYCDYWSGNIAVLVEEGSLASNNLDNVEIDTRQLPFQLQFIHYKDIQNSATFKQASIVLASIIYQQNHISQLCQALKIPCVYVTEYTLKTRIQIINANTQNPLLRLRRYWWEFRQEIKQKRAIRLASGLQCNGLPTYLAYQTINPKPLLYFDTRITQEMLINADALAKRTQHCLLQQPLRLLFSGRLMKIKGADHLILLAEALKKLGVQFELSICGNGELASSMAQAIIAKNLTDSVKMLGVLDFQTALIPYVQQHVDVFVCCHRQGDPSCTYLETMSCGVPIIGYANEAFSTLVSYAKTGWTVEMNNIDHMAKAIAELAQNREQIVEASYQSWEFSKAHTFEKSFQRRVEHLEALTFAPL